MFAMHCKPVRGSASEYVAVTELNRYLEADISIKTPLLRSWLRRKTPLRMLTDKSNLSNLNCAVSSSPYPLATHIIRPYVSGQNWVQFILLFFASVG
jgi:hypothetical protein